MRRREFIAIIGSVAATLSRTVGAQLGLTAPTSIRLRADEVIE